MSGDAKIYAVIAEMNRATIEFVFLAYDFSVNPLEETEDLRENLRLLYERGEIRSFDILAAADYAS